MFRPIFFLVLIGLTSHAFAAKDTLEAQGQFVAIKSENSLGLQKIENIAYWQNPKDMIKVHFTEFDTSFDALFQSTLKSIQQDANKFNIDNNIIAPADTQLLTTKTLLSNTEYHELLVLGGNETHAFKFSLSAPYPLSKTVKNNLQKLLNTFRWEPVNPSIVEDSPFTLQKLAGFRVTHKYANSVILQSDKSPESIDAYIVISFVEEKSTNASIKDRTRAIINDAKSLKEVEINRVIVSPEYKAPTAIARVSAELSSNDTPVDILHATQLHDSNLLITQIVVDKTSVSFLKLEDITKKILNSIQVN